MKKNIIVTGLPHSGKSTLLAAEVISEHAQKVGFITKEVQKQGARTGFEFISHRGTRIPLADIDIQSHHKISKYFVDVASIENILTEVISPHENDLLFIDEIGEMQLLSPSFKKVVSGFLDSENIFIATMTLVFKNEFIAKLRQRNDIILIELIQETRDSTKKFVSQLVTKISKARLYLADTSRFSVGEDNILLSSEHGLRCLYFSNNRGWICDCDFHKIYNICSHSIATESFCNHVEH